ncbi:heavy-metal-associated domain-containing protein [Microlunatus speluncae]|uniref:heavy-metal-associated domain-containing protein n=1 Tax=Microlunatus speluncae TaxID=2594267 RepID=UPI0012667608|nr:heavy-metal-associated domain-containing protein [Microlunatus speluncae]
MNPGLKFGGYAVALVLLLAGGFVAGRVLLPGSSAGPVAQPEPSATPGGHGGGEEHGGADPNPSGEPEEGEHGGHEAADPVRGLALEQDGFRLSGPAAPTRIDRDGTLSFKIIGPNGKPVTDFQVSHEKRLHLIVVRTDGTRFRHVHPIMAKDGTWSLPWRWTEPGSYRMFADFVPTATGDPTTLGYGFDVPGEVRPAKASKISTTSTVDGYRLTLAGELKASGESALTVTVTRNGKPVTTLQPYLGAYGHLVILRQGDLGYLHVHPEGAEPKPGATSGPEVAFIAQAPTPSRYLLYFDFQVDGVVRTAEFVLGSDPNDQAGHEASDHEHESGEQEER